MRQHKKVLLIDRSHSVLTDALEAMGCALIPLFETPYEELLPYLADAQGVVVRSRVRIDQAFLDAGPRLEFVARLGVGTEHIDLEYCRRRQVEVLTSPEGSRDTVAEHAMGMLLMLLNRLHIADREVRDGAWIREGNRGVEIKGKTVGILGYGNMGRAFAERLAGFGARVIAYDKFKTNYEDAFAEAVSLKELQEQSDILSIHIPYTPDNHYFISADFLHAFAKKIVVVNTARGTVLDTAALVDALKAGNVIGAALDVLEYEDMSFSHLDPAHLPEPFQYLRTSDKTILTPHIAGWSHESKLGHARVLAQKIEAFWTSGVKQASKPS